MGEVERSGGGAPRVPLAAIAGAERPPLDTDEDRLAAARSAMRSGAADASEVRLEQIVRRSPDAHEARVLLGYLRFKSGRYDRARAAFAEAIRIEPGDSYSRAMAARAALGMGDFEGARPGLEDALREGDESVRADLEILSARVAEFDRRRRLRARLEWGATAVGAAAAAVLWFTARVGTSISRR
jgi:predicted Zn-dependent protease